MLTKYILTVLLGSMFAFPKEIHKKTCRDRDGLMLPLLEFKISTCTMCYFYLIKESHKFHPIKGCRDTNDRTACLKKRSDNSCHCPSIDNHTSIDYVARTIHSPKLVEQWKWCCEDAEMCCQQQLSNVYDRTENNSECPQTWDGWMCWNATDKGSTVTRPCPRFLDYSDDNDKNYVSKTCTGNSSWWIDSKTNKEKTDYSNCLSQEVLNRLKFHQNTTIVSLAFNTLGIVLLVPAILIFLLYRNLRHQNRIKLHIHLFISLLVSGISVMCWDVVIKYKRIVNDVNHSVLQDNQNVCKVLNMLEHYCRSTTYFWMLCEGFYLHRLLVNAFVPPKQLIGYYITGWGMPFVITVTYAAIRLNISDDSKCWIDPVSGSYHGLEWVLFAPTILCIILNLFFLINILRILLRQLAHPNEPTSYRKAVKATFVLVPLLGIHQFFTIYRPLPGEKGYYFFTMTGAIIYNSQAIIISFIFCYFNGEVLSNLKTSWFRRNKAVATERRSITSMLTSRRSSAISLGSNMTRVLSGSSINGEVVFHMEANEHNKISKDNGIINNGFIALETTQL